MKMGRFEMRPGDFLPALVQRRARKRQIVAVRYFLDHTQVLGNGELTDGHIGEKTFKAARRQNDQMTARFGAQHLETMFLPPRDEGGFALAPYKFAPVEPEPYPP